MAEWFVKSFNNGQPLQLDALVYRLGVAFVLGGVVAGICWLTHRRDKALAPTFLSTLVLLTILIVMLTQVIGENLALAFSLAGVLAIVRFRTVVEDSRDTAFVILSVVVGTAIGTNHVEVALAGLVVAGLAAFLVRPSAANLGDVTAEWELTVRLGIGADPAKLEPVFRNHLSRQDTVATSTSRQGAALDFTYRVHLAASTTPTAFVAELNRVEGVQQVDLRRVAVTQ